MATGVRVRSPPSRPNPRPAAPHLAASTFLIRHLPYTAPSLYGTFLIRQAIHQSRDATGRFILLVDLRGFAMRNFDPYLVEHAFTIIFKHYPDAMAACYLL